MGEDRPVPDGHLESQTRGGAETMEQCYTEQILQQQAACGSRHFIGSQSSAAGQVERGS